jgi:hypothetical protein
MYAGETVILQGAESDEKLDTVSHANERVGRHHLRVTEETAKPKDGSDAEEDKVAMNVEKVKLQTQDRYSFMLILILVTGQQLDSTALQLNLQKAVYHTPANAVYLTD